MDIIIFSGQSNMQGQSESLTGTEAVSNAYEYKYLDHKFVPLKNPVGEDITYEKGHGFTFDNDEKQPSWHSVNVLGSACYGHTNLVPEFCRTYTEMTGKEVVAVHAAKGATDINEWIPTAKCFEMMVEKSAAAIKMANETGSVENIFLVWLQGESDAIFNRSNAEYKAKLTEINNVLKEKIGLKKFGIIRVGRFTNDDRDLEIISAQDDICRENEDFIMLTDIATELNTMPEYMNPYVAGHFGTKGLEKLGQEAGKTLAEYVNKNK